MASSFTFPLFSSLPPELRIQIWREALPTKLLPALYPYRRGYWCPRWLLPSEEGYDPDHEPNIDLEFRHDLLDDVQVELPLVFVNREARSIALAWTQKHDIKMRFCEKRQCHIFVRLLNLDRDALYVAPDRINDFYTESSDRIEEPDLLGHNINFSPRPSHFAIPAALLQGEDEDPLREMLDDFHCLEALSVIVNDTPPEFPENDIKVQREWELEGPEGQEQTWQWRWNLDRGAFDWDDDRQYMGDREAIYQRVKEASKGLVPTLVGNTIRLFEIRLVFAVRR